MVNIKWFGHSMWKIRNENVSIIIDPFTDIGYKIPQNESSNILLISHSHFDHNNISIIKGNPTIIKDEGKFNVSGVDIQTFSVWHDENQGAERGENLLIKFILSEKSFLHCGDLGHDLENDMVEKIGKIDVLFIPVGGHFTIDAKTAKKLVDKINPVIVFPMHYKTPVLDFPIANKEEYLNLVDNVKEYSTNQIDLGEEDFSESRTIILSYE